MELNKLKYFYLVAEYEHMTKAADAIHIAQPALTQAIHSLEEELGVPLFIKSGRNIRLSDYGRFLKSRLDVILPEIEALPNEIERLRNVANSTVKINILAASTFVINTIVDYRKKHPDVIIELEQNEQTSDCDIFIYTNGIRSRSSCCLKRVVKEERIYLAVPSSSPFSSKKSITLSEVKSEKFVMLSGSRLFRTICDRLCAVSGFTPQMLFESDSPVAVQNIISTGSGIAFWPEYSWGKIKNKNVHLLPIIEPVCQRELILELNEKSANSRFAEDFYEYLISKINTSR